ncbi:uncharacterized protein MELLADRAFT_124530 [Melampsora larici-populina 98AG31]|uniref:Secreted protein n=1 Tax=Melampsora larici-populina (strain 98AG31 / pathotype 3-4-7) TaxID=747676 RepID=F4S8Z9_MELLP|nr:uncharacterized protein MELLADRAFT_124530 [Melampsora larici-populina 98AG31]EGF98903.1 secreted protein [Melampsora larici-populina 98AG31]
MILNKYTTLGALIFLSLVHFSSENLGKDINLVDHNLPTCPGCTNQITILGKYNQDCGHPITCDCDHTWGLDCQAIVAKYDYYCSNCGIQTGYNCRAVHNLKCEISHKGIPKKFLGFKNESAE